MCRFGVAFNFRRLNGILSAAATIALLVLSVSSNPAAAGSPSPGPEGTPPDIVFAPAIHLGVGVAPRSVVIDDFDSAGGLDLAVSNPGTGDISILLGAGDGTFAPEMRVQLGPISQALAAADFDGDGNPDLAASDFGFGSPAGEVYVALGYGDGTFAPAIGYDAGLHPGFLVSADVDGDGLIDLALASSGGGLKVLLNLGGGTFGPAIPVSPDAPSAVRLTSLATGEFNDDGLADLAMTSYYPFECGFPDIATLWLSLGDGAFTPRAGLDAVCPQDVVAGDLDADGLDDLAVVDALNQVNVGLNLGAATFGPAVIVPAPVGPLRALLDDFNGDGMPDLAVAGSLNVVVVRPGLGETSFGNETQILLSDEFRSMAAGDLDGDGAADLVLTEPNLGSVALLLTGTPVGNAPPLAVAGPDAQLECTSTAGGLAHLDGTMSTDPDSTPGTNDDIVAYDWYENFGQPSESLLGSGDVVDVPLAVGPHVVTLRVTDTGTATATDEVVITITDTVPPVLAVSLAPSMLWPPNHRMVDVAAVIVVSDLCGPTSLVLESVMSSEPDDAPGGGDGATVLDIQEVEPGTADPVFRLRAERAATGSGRVYTAAYRAADAAGNASISAPFATVPHDVGGMTEPLMLSAYETGSGTVVAWDAVAGAAFYNVVRGEVKNMVYAPDVISLGPLACLAMSTTRTDTIGLEDSELPPSGEAYFYLAEFDDGLASGYGTESALLERVANGGAPCP